MISLHNVSKKFGPHVVLESVSFKIDGNDFVILTGASGAGKSTIVNLLIGAEKPNLGTVEVDGLIVNEMDEETLQLYRRKIGVVHQDYKLLPKKTVYENVAFALEVSEISDDEIHDEVPQILDKVGLLHFQDKFPDQLSGGEKQRLAIARALAHKPKFIIADEPTGNLDEENVKAIMELLKKLHEVDGVTILVTTHDPLVKESVTARNLNLEAGKITES